MTNATVSSDVLKTIIDGSNNAVRSIVRKRYSNLFTEMDIEEVIGEARLRAWNSISSYDPNRGDVFSWVYKISRNCVLDAVDDIVKYYPFDDDMELIDKKGNVVNVSDTLGYTDDTWNADYDITQKEFNEQWGKVTSTLSDIDKRHYEMIDEGYKPREIAAELGCTPAAASMRKIHIQQKLKPYAMALAKEYDINLKK